MEEDKIERYIRRKKREIIQIETDGLYGGVVHAESYHSELGNELGKEYPHLDYIAILNLGGKKISFRTIHDDVDVSAVAGEFGGGGHAKASGCSINKEAYNRYIEQAFPLDPIKPDAFRNTYNLKDSKNGCLYENRDRDFYLIYTDGTRYFVQQESKERHGPFEGFELAERFVKREYGAALARDDVYISYLENIVFNGGN